MNVLLINPAAPNIAKISKGFDLAIDSVGRFPPVGLMALAAYVRVHSKHRVTILDADAEGSAAPAILGLIKSAGIEVVGLTAFTYTFYDVLQVVKAVRESYPEVRIVLGGPHTTLFPRETLSHPEIDYLVIGEGEEPFLHLLDRLSERRRPDHCDGLGFREEGGAFIGSPAWVRKLDDLPYPAYDLVNPEHYHSTFGYGGKTLTLNSSRGCPYQCAYCQVLVKKYRAHSIPYIIGCVRRYFQEGYRSFYFFDDVFNITAGRVVEFSRAIRREKLDIKWIFRGRVEQLNEEAIREAAAGCVQVLLGIEDYTDENLKAIKKKLTIEQARNVIRLARKHGIRTSTNWILGMPTHRSEDDLRRLVDVAIGLDSDYAMFGIIQLLPGCEMFEQAVAEGAIRRESWADYARNPTPSYQIEPYEKYMSLEQVGKWYAKAHRRFYRRPAYLFRRLLDIRSLSQLRNQLPVALKVLSARK